MLPPTLTSPPSAATSSVGAKIRSGRVASTSPTLLNPTPVLVEMTGLVSLGLLSSVTLPPAESIDTLLASEYVEKTLRELMASIWATDSGRSVGFTMVSIVASRRELTTSCESPSASIGYRTRPF